MRGTDSYYRLVREAWNALRQRRAEEASVILERVLAAGVSDPYIHFLLAVASLYTSQFPRADTLITAIKTKDPGFLPVLQLEAFMRLKSAASREDAQAAYIDLFSRFPADSVIARARRSLAAAGDFAAFQRGARLPDYVHLLRPPTRLKKHGVSAFTAASRTAKPRRGPWRLRRRLIPGRRVLIILIIAFSIAAAAALGLVIARSGVAGRFMPVSSDAGKSGARDRSVVDQVGLSGMEFDLIRNTMPDVTPEHYRSTAEIREDFDAARRLIKQGEYNRAVIMLNRIENSNASFPVKEKAEFLVKFVMDVDDRSFEEIVPARVKERPYRYRGAAVQWTGSVSRIRRKSGSASLLLVITPAGGGVPVLVPEVYWQGELSLKERDRVVVKGVITGIIGRERTIVIEAREIAPAP